MTTATTNKPDLKQELLAQERAYLDGVQNNDAEATASLTDASCLIVSGHGVMSADPAAVKKMAAEHDNTNSYEIDEPSMSVLSLTDDVAVVAYKLRTIPKEGRATEAYDTDVWVRRGDRWLCASHTETPVTGA